MDVHLKAGSVMELSPVQVGVVRGVDKILAQRKGHCLQNELNHVRRVDVNKLSSHCGNFHVIDCRAVCAEVVLREPLNPVVSRMNKLRIDIKRYLKDFMKISTDLEIDVLSRGIFRPLIY